LEPTKVLSHERPSGQEIRPDRVEAAFWAGIARNVATTAETKDTGAVPVAGGYAVVVQGSGLAIALGIGTRRPLRADDLQTIAAFFAERGLEPRIELAADVYERDGAMLAEAGYRLEGRLGVYARDPVGTLPAPDLPPVAGLKRAAWIGAFGAPLEANAAHALTAIRGDDGELVAGAAVAVNGDTALILFLAGVPGPAASSALVTGLAAGQARGATRALLKLADEDPLIDTARANGFAVAEQRYRLAIPAAV
jgi:hypothetical protein